VLGLLDPGELQLLVLCVGELLVLVILGVDVWVVLGQLVREELGLFFRVVSVLLV
jgi:hypothetical protein